ncbi:hypothetical protein GSI_13604 [Ganoderma sinense ZZ0214-1]|uniref:UFSP1/2/DUB catalytic domain-containing protein n=1 Tax=Ganoderma sinense ZZ0214-1 TaxID=1077348 RepID=A0A2G8RQS1_9APHY|nr:hypothetical protein GSI_13604 [Ganoderma sinense ZZ0214-1]
MLYFSGDSRRHSTSATVGERLLGARAINVTDKPPIILQHKGHSRTIIGVEQAKNGVINLLTFDPGRRLPSHIKRIALQYHTPAKLTGLSKSFLPKKVLDTALLDTIKSRKRKSPEPHGGGGKRKRESSGNRDVIIIDDDEDEDRGCKAKPPSSSHQQLDFDTLSPAEVLKIFRLDNKMLRKNKKYQVLWFPMTEPLTEAQKLNRQIVTSEKVT